MAILYRHFWPPEMRHETTSAKPSRLEPFSLYTTLHSFDFWEEVELTAVVIWTFSRP